MENEDDDFDPEQEMADHLNDIAAEIAEGFYDD
jgi:hypothetical protein